MIRYQKQKFVLNKEFLGWSKSLRVSKMSHNLPELICYFCTTCIETWLGVKTRSDKPAYTKWILHSHPRETIFISHYKLITFENFGDFEPKIFCSDWNQSKKWLCGIPSPQEMQLSIFVFPTLNWLKSEMLHSMVVPPFGFHMLRLVTLRVRRLVKLVAKFKSNDCAMVKQRQGSTDCSLLSTGLFASSNPLIPDKRNINQNKSSHKILQNTNWLKIWPTWLTFLKPPSSTTCPKDMSDS